MLAKRLAGKTTTLLISFSMKGFPYKHQIEELFIQTVAFHIFRTRNIFNFPIISFLTATYFSKAQWSLFVLKVPLNPNQSINPSLTVSHCLCDVQSTAGNISYPA